MKKKVISRDRQITSQVLSPIQEKTLYLLDGTKKVKTLTSIQDSTRGCGILLKTCGMPTVRTFEQWWNLLKIYNGVLATISKILHMGLLNISKIVVNC